MGTKEKLIERFLSQPSDFTYSEVVKLFGIFNYTERQKGATSGSRVEFVSADGKRSFIKHKPHPSNIIKRYAMRQIMTYLIDNTNLKSMKQ